MQKLFRTKFILSKDPRDQLTITDGFGHKIILSRIVATRNIYNTNGELIVQQGEKGGFVEHEGNLSQKGSCWVFDDAQVFGRAMISGDAKIYDKAKIYGRAKVYDHAIVCDCAQVFEDAQVFGKAMVSDFAEIGGEALIDGNLHIVGGVKVGNKKHDAGSSETSR